jgi:DNA-binding PadR family transcriptional regulator
MTKSWKPNILGFSILQLLERFSLSGYDVKKRFATSLAYGWYAHDSQIYPQLRQLEEHGLVESRVETSSAGPDRRVYTPTPTGEAALRAWLQSPFDDSRQKSELMLRVWSLDLVPVETFLALLSDVTCQTEARLGELTALYKTVRTRYGPPELTDNARHVGVQLCLEHDIQQAQAKLAWVARATRVVEMRAALAPTDDDRAGHGSPGRAEGP